jgi:hypothetical protein
MDQDDPENRIAELERRLAEQKRIAGRQLADAQAAKAVGQVGVPQPDPRSTPGPPPPTSSPQSRPKVGLHRAGAILLLVFFPLIFFGTGAYEFYQYLSGAPTTATIDHCEHARGGPKCTGTWSLGGTPHRGSINGDEVYPDGSLLDVRVHGGGLAYTAGAGNEGFLAGGGTLAIVAVVGVLPMWWRRRTGR